MTLKTASPLLEEKIKTPEFHVLLKTHKANNPSRPVISSGKATPVQVHNL